MKIVETSTQLIKSQLSKIAEHVETDTRCLMRQTPDVISLSSKQPPAEYADVVENMVAQRAHMTNTVHPSMSVEETLQGYKDNYVWQNREIREGIMQQNGERLSRCTSSSLQSAIPKLDALISQSSLPRDTVLYRVGSPYDFGFSKMSSDEFIRNFYKQGKLFRIPIFPETSLDLNLLKSFFSGRDRILFKINAPKGTNGVYMERLGCEQFGNFADEEEVMLMRNLIYKFKGHTKSGAYDIVEVDVVPKKPFFRKVHEFWNEVPKTV